VSARWTKEKSLVATWEPNEIKVLSTIRDLGLELDVVFNKGAVMILPAGANKGTGLLAALKDLQTVRAQRRRSRRRKRMIMPSFRFANVLSRSPMRCPRSRAASTS